MNSKREGREGAAPCALPQLSVNEPRTRVVVSRLSSRRRGSGPSLAAMSRPALHAAYA
jgi:hypothetical protein